MEYDWEMDTPGWGWDSEWDTDDETDALTAEYEAIIDELLDYLEAIIGDTDDWGAGWDEWDDDTLVM
jgi:hypothetical protein